MPQNTFFHALTILWSAQKWCKDTFSILHHLSPIIFANASVVAFVLLCSSRFSFHCYTQHEATEHLLRNQHRSGSCNLTWAPARKITKGIHLCKPASLNCPVCMSTVITQTWCHVEFDWLMGCCCKLCFSDSVPSDLFSVSNLTWSDKMAYFVWFLSLKKAIH